MSFLIIIVVQFATVPDVTLSREQKDTWQSLNAKHCNVFEERINPESFGRVSV